MFCPNCGKEQADNPRFCRNCGAELVQESSILPDMVGMNTEVENNIIKPQYMVDSKLKIKSIIKIINISLSFVFAGLFLLLFAIQGGFPKVIQEGSPTIDALIIAYVFWGWYWGLQLLWSRYVNSAKYEGKAPDAFLMRLWMPVFYFPIYLCLAGIVGVFGGGIYKFVKYCRKETT